MLASVSLRSKMVIVGNAGCGKTALLTQICTQRFNSTTASPTVGVGFMTRSVFIGDSTVRFQIWDTAGQERFRSLISSYARDANVALVAVDLTNYQSLASIGYWINYIRTERGDDALITLVGTKCDVAKRTVTANDVEGHATHYNVPYIETSAKNGTNCDTLMTEIASNVLASNLATRKRPSLVSLDDALDLDLDDDEEVARRDRSMPCVC